LCTTQPTPAAGCRSRHEEVLALLDDNRLRLDGFGKALLEHETLGRADAYAAAGLTIAARSAR